MFANTSTLRIIIPDARVLVALNYWTFYESDIQFWDLEEVSCLQTISLMWSHLWDSFLTTYCGLYFLIPTFVYLYLNITMYTIQDWKDWRVSIFNFVRLEWAVTEMGTGCFRMMKICHTCIRELKGNIWLLIKRWDSVYICSHRQDLDKSFILL